MSEEEKKGIDRIEDTFYNNLAKGIKDFQKITLYEDGIQDIRMLLNLAEKLQKGNEKLKGLIAHKNEYTKKLEEDLFENSSNYVIPIQRIKDKIEEYKKMSDKLYIKFLENNRYDADLRDKGIKCDAIVQALQELIEGRE